VLLVENMMLMKVTYMKDWKKKKELMLQSSDNWRGL
jgi:hypothetical protein